MKKSIVKRLAILATIGVMTMTCASAAFADDTVTMDTQQVETENVEETQITAEQSDQESISEISAQSDNVSNTNDTGLTPLTTTEGVKHLENEQKSETLLLSDAVSDSMTCVLTTNETYIVTYGENWSVQNKELVKKTWKFEFSPKNGQSLNQDICAQLDTYGNPPVKINKNLANDNSPLILTYDANGYDAVMMLDINGHIVYVDDITGSKYM